MENEFIDIKVKNHRKKKGKMKKIKIIDILKRRKAWMIVVVLILIIITGFISLSINIYPSLNLKTDTIAIEYGTAISLNAEDYVDMEMIDDSIIDDITVTTNAVNETEAYINEDGDEVIREYDYPSIGEYTVTLSYRNHNYYVTVSVID